MASRVYFDKHASELTLPEAALLAGCRPARAPTTRRRARRPPRPAATVLGLMLEQGLITATDYRAPTSRLCRGRRDRPSGLEGPSRLLRRVRQAAARALLRLRRRLRGRAQDLHVDRPRAAEARARAIEGGCRAARARRPSSRSTRATAASSRWWAESFEKSQFNLAVQGQRQTGSAFKPFVLTAAVEQGISPQTVFTSEPTVINLGDKLWSVRTTRARTSGRSTSRRPPSTRTTRSMRSSPRRSGRRTWPTRRTSSA